ncbi:hypothetical protein A1QO_04175 [Vibrio genomosp. F10 str. ZF-129]|uniref:Uncharacterized protein n=1 Tax=Vibrio genomosp. F10 str. ZF-129 TaxID=1187848 RepID=A0A1E5BIN5_9VIBR|nr:DNA cytosine methyltransferase [Vibrio genomosp. F10]OEE37309.1 hypothetical protein A1QO_04175 [Vibrio genomosp. F10 str. ZF-129]
MINASVHIPDDFMSKKLKITNYPCGKRKIQISSNWLPLYLFEKGTKVIEKIMDNDEGITVSLASKEPLVHKPKQIYQREYKKRTNKPFEELYEISAKSLLDKVIPKNCEFVHVIFTMGKLFVRPWVNALAKRIAQVVKSKRPFSCFAVCSSGIDAYAAYERGFEINSLLDARPKEKRDGDADLSETGVLTAIANLPIKQVYNEDINTIDAGFVKRTATPSTVFTVSLQCNDVSHMKPKEKKEKALVDLSSSIDMAYDGLRLIESVQPPVVVLEQVRSFLSSDLYKMWELRLAKWGYTVYTKTMMGIEHGSHTPRARCFSVATSLPSAFSFPEIEEQEKTSFWDRVIAKHIPFMRDVSHSKSLQDGLKCGRLRIINSQSTHSPTPLKSQPQMAKDSLIVVDDDGRFLWPTNQLLRELMSIPTEFDQNITGATIETNVIGQAVDFKVYSQLMQSVKNHIQDFLDMKNPLAKQLINHKSPLVNKPAANMCTQSIPFNPLTQEDQLALF